MQNEHGEVPVVKSARGNLGCSPLKAADFELLYDSLRDAEKRVALLTDVIEALSQSRDAASLLQRSVESVVRAIDASGAFVYLWNEEIGQFVLAVATEGHQKAFVGRISLRPGEGLTGWSALMRRPVLIGRNLDSDPRVVMFPELLEEDFRSCLIVPILIPGGDPVGVFSIYSVAEEAFTDNDLRLVDEVARLLASGIDRAHVVDQWERQSAALESLIGLAEAAPQDVQGCLAELIHRATAIVPSDIGIVETLDYEGSMGDSAAVATRRPLPDHLGEDVRSEVVMTAATARQLVKSASPAFQSASIPMRLGERTVGVVTTYRSSAYTAADRSVLEAIASYGALALQAISSRTSGDSALGKLVSAQSDEEAAAVLERHGWQAGSWATPVVIRCDPDLSLSSGRSLDSVVNTVESVFSGRWRRVMSATPGVVAALVMSRDQPTGSDAVTSWAVREVGAALEDKGQTAGIAIGVGNAACTPAEIAAECRLAARAMSWASLTSEGVRLAEGDDNSLGQQIMALSRSLTPAVRGHLETVQRVKDYDDRHGTDLLGTLEVFVREHGSVQQASDRLYIHRNTLRQRLNRISVLAEQPGGSVDDWLPLLLSILILREH
ncbi:MAG: GAF domain-containing protein [Actinomycetota bacterium]|nr:GAF domain-containing protein [Actinomycetota bacterium]